MSKHRYELLKELIVTGHLDLNWAIKNIFGSKSEYRKSKINRIFNV